MRTKLHRALLLVFLAALSALAAAYGVDWLWFVDAVMRLAYVRWLCEVLKERTR